MTAPAPLTRKVPQPVVEHTETLVIVSSPRDDMCGPTRPATPADIIAFLPMLDDMEKANAMNALSPWTTGVVAEMHERADAAESALAAMTAERDEARRHRSKAHADIAQLTKDLVAQHDAWTARDEKRNTEEREPRADRDREHLRADNAEAEAMHQAGIAKRALDREDAALAKVAALEGLRQLLAPLLVPCCDRPDHATWERQVTIKEDFRVKVRAVLDALPAPSSGGAEAAADINCSAVSQFGNTRCALHYGHPGNHTGSRFGPLGGTRAEWPQDYQPAPSETGEAGR